MQAARGVEARLGQLGILPELVDERHVVLVRPDHGVEVAEEALVVLALARGVRVHGLEHAVAHERAGEDDDVAKPVGAQQAVDERGVGTD